MVAPSLSARMRVAHHDLGDAAALAAGALHGDSVRYTRSSVQKSAAEVVTLPRCSAHSQRRHRRPWRQSGAGTAESPGLCGGTGGQRRPDRQPQDADGVVQRRAVAHRSTSLFDRSSLRGIPPPQACCQASRSRRRHAVPPVCEPPQHLQLLLKPLLHRAQAQNAQLKHEQSILGKGRDEEKRGATPLVS